MGRQWAEHEAGCGQGGAKQAKAEKTGRKKRAREKRTVGLWAKNEREGFSSPFYFFPNPFSFLNSKQFQYEPNRV